MQARSSVRKSEILTAARRLLLERGYEGMTVAMVAEKAGASLGSVTHFFKTKEAIAAAVADEVIAAIATGAQAALGAGRNIEQSVGNLVAAALAWPKKFPGYRELTPYAVRQYKPGKRQGRRGVQARLEALLAEWARPMILEGKIAVLSSAELFALVLAPAMCDTSGPVAGSPTDAPGWTEVVSSAALKAIKPDAKARKSGKSSAATSAPDLFGGALDRQPPPGPGTR